MPFLMPVGHTHYVDQWEKFQMTSGLRQSPIFGAHRPEPTDSGYLNFDLFLMIDL
jgi:hypothetical protein